jgi:hypothetical protein
MNNLDFLKKENISMLWDVISDEQTFKYLQRESQGKVSEIFINNINGFFEIERKKSINLIEINKKYIMLVLNFIKRNFEPQKPNKIKIFDDPVKELITYEEIQSEKKSQFEYELAKRQEEFTNAITLKVPEVPEFTDKYKETPILEMDKIIKEMTLKRNYEVEQINRNYQSDINNTNNWLKPQETSVKSDKLIQENSEKLFQTQNQNQSKSKYIHTFNEFIESPSKKNVSWGENKEINYTPIDDSKLETNLFQKLKKINRNEQVNASENNITLTIQENSIQENSNQDRVLELENNFKILNSKLDMVLNILINK